MYIYLHVYICICILSILKERGKKVVVIVKFGTFKFGTLMGGEGRANHPLDVSPTAM